MVPPVAPPPPAAAGLAKPVAVVAVAAPDVPGFAPNAGAPPPATFIERLEEEKKTIAADIKEVYAEAKANGFDTKILRKVISVRKKDHAEREEEEALLSLYMHALGMAPDLEEPAAAQA